MGIRFFNSLINGRGGGGGGVHAVIRSAEDSSKGIEIGIAEDAEWRLITEDREVGSQATLTLDGEATDTSLDLTLPHDFIAATTANDWVVRVKQGFEGAGTPEQFDKVRLYIDAEQTKGVEYIRLDSGGDFWDIQVQEGTETSVGYTLDIPGVLATVVLGTTTVSDLLVSSDVSSEEFDSVVFGGALPEDVLPADLTLENMVGDPSGYFEFAGRAAQVAASTDVYATTVVAFDGGDNDGKGLLFRAGSDFAGSGGNDLELSFPEGSTLSSTIQPGTYGHIIVDVIRDLTDSGTGTTLQELADYVESIIHGNPDGGDVTFGVAFIGGADGTEILDQHWPSDRFVLVNGVDSGDFLAPQSLTIEVDSVNQDIELTVTTHNSLDEIHRALAATTYTDIDGQTQTFGYSTVTLNGVGTDSLSESTYFSGNLCDFVDVDFSGGVTREDLEATTDRREKSLTVRYDAETDTLADIVAVIERARKIETAVLIYDTDGTDLPESPDFTKIFRGINSAGGGGIHTWLGSADGGIEISHAEATTEWSLTSRDRRVDPVLPTITVDGSETGNYFEIALPHDLVLPSEGNDWDLQIEQGAEIVDEVLPTATIDGEASSSLTITLPKTIAEPVDGNDWQVNIIQGTEALAAIDTVAEEINITAASTTTFQEVIDQLEQVAGISRFDFALTGAATDTLSQSDYFTPAGDGNSTSIDFSGGVAYFAGDPISVSLHNTDTDNGILVIAKSTDTIEDIVTAIRDISFTSRLDNSSLTFDHAHVEVRGHTLDTLSSTTYFSGNVGDQVTGDFSGGLDIEELEATLSAGVITVLYDTVADTLGQVQTEIESIGASTTLINGATLNSVPETPGFSRGFRGILSEPAGFVHSVIQDGSDEAQGLELSFPFADSEWSLVTEDRRVDPVLPSAVLSTDSSSNYLTIQLPTNLVLPSIGNGWDVRVDQGQPEVVESLASISLDGEAADSNLDISIPTDLDTPEDGNDWDFRTVQGQPGVEGTNASNTLDGTTTGNEITIEFPTDFFGIGSESDGNDWELTVRQGAAAIAGEEVTYASTDYYLTGDDSDKGLRVTFNGVGTYTINGTVHTTDGAGGNSWLLQPNPATVSSTQVFLNRAGATPVVRVFYSNDGTFTLEDLHDALAAHADPDLNVEYLGTDAASALLSTTEVTSSAFSGGVDGTPSTPRDPLEATIDEDNRRINLRALSTDTFEDVEDALEAIEYTDTGGLTRTFGDSHVSITAGSEADTLAARYFQAGVILSSDFANGVDGIIREPLDAELDQKNKRITLTSVSTDSLVVLAFLLENLTYTDLDGSSQTLGSSQCFTTQVLMQMVLSESTFYAGEVGARSG